MMNPLIPFNSILSQFAHQSGIASFDAQIDVPGEQCPQHCRVAAK
jgi:hypothetical protein